MGKSENMDTTYQDTDDGICWDDAMDLALDMNEAVVTHNRERLADDAFYLMAELACGNGNTPSPFSWNPKLGLARSWNPNKSDAKMIHLGKFLNAMYTNVGVQFHVNAKNAMAGIKPCTKWSEILPFMAPLRNSIMDKDRKFIVHDMYSIYIYLACKDGLPARGMYNFGYDTDKGIVCNSLDVANVLKEFFDAMAGEEICEVEEVGEFAYVGIR